MEWQHKRCSETSKRFHYNCVTRNQQTRFVAEETRNAVWAAIKELTTPLARWRVA